ncbi:flavin reductase family protein [Rhodococcus koreensis]|uniref:flavin reductase family protein n=1 Tax=Rhodococcus koreensis TaxID=99653 RepID=UPI00366CE8A1
MEPAERYLSIAGGVRITPIRAMVHAAHRADFDWKLLYGGRTQQSMAFVDDLTAFGERVEIRPQDVHGHLDLEALVDESAVGTAIYCCGPRSLMGAVSVMAGQRPTAQVHFERFQAEISESGPVNAVEFRLVLSKSGQTLTVPCGTSILEAVRAVGVEAPSSCGEGICGTCETGVIDGTPDHRDSVLTREERESGETIMICVSRSQTDTLVLNL